MKYRLCRKLGHIYTIGSRLDFKVLYPLPDNPVNKFNCHQPYINFPFFNLSGPCDAGYICSYNATRPTPTFEEGVLEWGGVCSAGHFCPSGTTSERKCLEGTYR